MGRPPAIDIAGVQNAVDEKRELRGFSRLKRVEQVVSLVSRSLFEIDCGGFEGFYYNTAGNYAVETVEAFETIGAIKTAEIVRRANNLFAERKPPKGRVARYKALKAMEPARQKKMRDLLGKFDNGSENIDRLLEKFIVANRGELGLEDG